MSAGSSRNVGGASCASAEMPPGPMSSRANARAGKCFIAVLLSRARLLFTMGLREAETDGQSSGVAPIDGSQLADDVGDVKLDRARADVELIGNLGVGETLAK
jgi:hypothetical protein